MQDVLTIDPAQLAQLMPGGEAGALQQVAVQVEGEPGEDATQVIAQLVQADLPSPGKQIIYLIVKPYPLVTFCKIPYIYFVKQLVYSNYVYMFRWD